MLNAQLVRNATLGHGNVVQVWQNWRDYFESIIENRCGAKQTPSQ